MGIKFDLNVGKKLFYLRRDAIERGIDWHIGFLSMSNLMKAKKCYYTGIELTDSNFSVDRVDSSKGYIKGNVVACHKTFNYLKGTLENKRGSLDIDLVIKGIKKTYKILDKISPRNLNKEVNQKRS